MKKVAATLFGTLISVAVVVYVLSSGGSDPVSILETCFRIHAGKL